MLEKRNLTETTIIRIVAEIRNEDPGIGAYKLFVMLKELYAEKMSGRDKFYDLLRHHHLMLKPQRKRHTTNSNHNYRKYKNMIKNFMPTAPNELWVADITYIETKDGVCYPHLITDAFTHEIIGWTLSDTLMATNTISALEQAIKQADGASLSKLIHHSDRGSQYCCNAYVELLNSISATISMTEDYKPTDNAIAERVNGIIKQEWLYRMDRPENLKDARKLLNSIINFYNNKRPHMSNNMKTPAEMRMLFR